MGNASSQKHRDATEAEMIPKGENFKMYEGFSALWLLAMRLYPDGEELRKFLYRK